MKTPTRPARILFVLEYYYPHVGGGEFLFRTIAEGLAAKGFSVSVLTSHLPGTPTRETIGGVDIIRARVPQKGARYFFTFIAFFYLLRYGWKFDYLHTTTYNAAPPTSIFGLISRKPTYITILEVWGDLWYRLPGIGGLSRRLLNWFEQLIIHLPYTRFICISQSTLRQLTANHPRAKQSAGMIYCGLDMPEKAPQVSFPKKGSKQTIISYSRPGISKGLENLVDAFNACTNEQLFLRLVVSRDELPRYTLIANRITNPRISIEPSLPKADLVAAIKAADYVVIPSLAEGFGYSALEACTYGKPVICSNQGSLPEVAYGRILFYDPWKPETLTQSLNALSPERFEEIPMRRFPVETMIEAYAKLYR